MEFYLRELARTDIPLLNAWRNDRTMVEMLGAPYRFIAEEVDQAWYERYMQSRERTVRLAVCMEGRAEPIGAVYLLNIDWVNRAAEFAIWIGNKSCQGKGAGEAATRSILAHAFNDLNLHRIYLTVLETNDRARALYQKVGFIEEGRLRSAVFKGGEYLDMVQMSILKQEYVRTNSDRA